MIGKQELGRRSFIGAACGGALVAPAVVGAVQSGLPSLRVLSGSEPLIGVAVPTRYRKHYSAVEMGLLEQHFDSVTPENCMKWHALSPSEGVYNFTFADDLLAYAQKRQMAFVGHTLVFNRKGNYPDWLFRDGEKQADAKLVWQRLEKHLETVMTRYKGKIDSWDVLNEFVEVKDPGYRHTDFTEVLGPDYPIRLFKIAEQLDPKSKLTYNDFAIENPKRRAKILTFIKKLQDAGCRIDVVGSQSHLEIGHDIKGELVQTIADFAAIGVKCAFTELDVDVVSRKPYWNMQTREDAKKQNPYPTACPPEILEQQAKVYKDVFAAVATNPKWVDRVTFWGLTDKFSWLNTWPWKRTNHGLLFDRNGQAKPAFHAVAKSLLSG